ncbi:hypothetical protein CkaCkLH20_10510 [Colletotrichum karsti]|uniref:Oxidoreductase n=1 Tax=Colletotrichum karsti TaxID=1095194 RepID=A0A9P6HW24_9PEZI|nr:uncharacterized protein CkaCkLH20_10510 [Colletotrichum karsti]KAF9871878.1 hypothetical protein CkaCkLH20_10510 [Colletotrichum karsti]
MEEREQQKTDTQESDLGAKFQQDLRRAAAGLKAIYTHEKPLPLRVTASYRQIIHDMTGHWSNECTSTPEELDWLEAFLRCVKWMEAEHPRLAADLKVSSARAHDQPRIEGLEEPETKLGVKPVGKGVLLEASDFQDFIENSAAESVAQQLRADLKVSKEGKTSELPSLTALYMPEFSSPRAKEIAKSIWADESLHISVRQMLYEQMLETIKKQLSKDAKMDTADGQGEVQSYETQRSRKCYICHMDLQTSHKTLKSMCIPCGEFNLAERALSLPPNLSLEGKTALVTGARINLGFHTALRLLRCGAFVIASSRYPEDALSRYQTESDYASWAPRLKIVGADFRAAKDAFALVEATKATLQQENRKLDILINNAAQTLTDPVEKEQMAVKREQRLLEGSRNEESSKQVITRQGYTARVRGGAVADAITGKDGSHLLGQSTHVSNSLVAPMSNLRLSEPSKQSSWVQSLSEIPYEDVITAHSVNTFVPLILIRELMPSMARGGHIVNVSSREGIFESNRRSSAKTGKHVHTNMSKAGLNMITETEAATAWEEHKVAMNTVDPGYMSAAPEFELAFDGERPIGWEDGAGRVLWPIAKSEKGAPIWGRFLKHYGAARVDTRFGRG